jgi:hypothetical protein
MFAVQPCNYAGTASGKSAKDVMTATGNRTMAAVHNANKKSCLHVEMGVAGRCAILTRNAPIHSLGRRGRWGGALQPQVYIFELHHKGRFEHLGFPFLLGGRLFYLAV